MVHYLTFIRLAPILLCIRIDNELDEIQFAIVTHDTQWVGLGVSEAGGMIGSDIALFQSSNPDIVTDSYVLEDRCK